MLTITDSYLKGQLPRNFIFGMEFDPGGWVFGKVLTFDDIDYKYDRFPTSGALFGQLAANSALASPHELVDASTNNPLWVKDRSHVYQVFAGIAPPRLRLFRFYPDLDIGGSLDTVPAAQTPTSTSGGYTDGTSSPYDDPTIALETIIPIELRVQWQLFNPEAFAVTPLVRFLIRRLVVKWFNPMNAADADLINKIINNKLPCHLWTPGAYLPKYDTVDKLGIEGTKWDTGSGTYMANMMTRTGQVRQKVSDTVQSAKRVMGFGGDESSPDGNAQTYGMMNRRTQGTDLQQG